MLIGLVSDFLSMRASISELSSPEDTRVSRLCHRDGKSRTGILSLAIQRQSSEQNRHVERLHEELRRSNKSHSTSARSANARFEVLLVLTRRLQGRLASGLQTLASHNAVWGPRTAQVSKCRFPDRVFGGLKSVSEPIRLLLSGCPPGRPLWDRFLCPRLARRLDGVRGNDRPYQTRKALFQLNAARDVLHLHAMPFAPNQASLAKDPEMLREGGLWNRFIAYSQEVRAVVRALLRDDVGIYSHPYRVRQCVENPLYRHLVNRRM